MKLAATSTQERLINYKIMDRDEKSKSLQCRGMKCLEFNFMVEMVITIWLKI